MRRESRWDDIAERYKADSAGSISGPVAEAVLEILSIDRGSRVLDVGCGPGNWARQIASLGAAVTGVDASARLLEFAQEQEDVEPLGINYIEASASDRQLLVGQKFDRILANMSLSDIDDLSGALANVQRLLAPDGLFVFTILHPCFPGAGSSLPSWPEAGYFEEGWWIAAGHHGYRGVVGANHRTLSTYLNALRDAGLRLDHVSEPATSHVLVPMFLVVRATLP